jgi:hypothetical protein
MLAMTVVHCVARMMQVLGIIRIKRRQIFRAPQFMKTPERACFRCAVNNEYEYAGEQRKKYNPEKDWQQKDSIHGSRSFRRQTRPDASSRQPQSENVKVNASKIPS